MIKRFYIQKTGLFAVIFLASQSLLAAFPPRYEEALGLFQNRKYNESLEVIRSVFDDHKDSLEFRMLAAANYVELGNYKSAQDHMYYALKDHPDSLDALVFLAVSFRKEGRPFKAIDTLRGALQKYPNDLRIRYEIAASYYDLKKYSNARAHVSKMLAVDSNHFPALYLDGLCYMQEGSFENAEFRFRNAVRVKYENMNARANLYTNLAFTLERLADTAKRENKTETAEVQYEESEDYYKKSLELRPDQSTKTALERLQKKL